MNQPNDHTITLKLNDREERQLAALAHEYQLDRPDEVLRVLLRDAVEVYDALWEKTFADSQDVLDRLADEAHEEYAAGRTDEFDPDNDPDLA